MQHARSERNKWLDALLGFASNPELIGLPNVAGMGALHNKHRNACGEHPNRSESHDNPSEARTRLTLHELLVRSDQKKGCQQSVDDSGPIERLDWIDAEKVQPDTHSR
jgi:hypothetical protein